MKGGGSSFDGLDGPERRRLAQLRQRDQVKVEGGEADHVDDR